MLVFVYTCMRDDLVEVSTALSKKVKGIHECFEVFMNVSSYHKLKFSHFYFMCLKTVYLS